MGSHSLRNDYLLCRNGNKPIGFATGLFRLWMLTYLYLSTEKATLDGLLKGKLKVKGHWFLIYRQANKVQTFLPEESHMQVLQSSLKLISGL
jgi:hypothetical protein